MIYLNNKLKGLGVEHSEIREMIYSEKYGEKLFNLNVKDRNRIMKVLYEDEDFFPIV